MSTIQSISDVNLTDGRYNVGLSLIEFMEDKVTIVYSPALDLSGTGYSKKEAHESFAIALHEFVRYTSTKKNLDKVLKGLGWTIKDGKKPVKYSPPKDSDMASSNPTYNEIINHKEFKVSREEVALAI